ncbi:hypothetical protein B0H11DRAFT_2123015 [Mycena galericulata]|nr:hypothetical protein B0H11DRAFT_2123015 [Mycena galericulata]
MYEDLFRLCLPSADIAQTLIDAAVSLTLKRICLASERYGIRVAHWLSKLPGGQIPEVLKRLVTGLPMLLNYANESTALALNLCEFLARVWQITGENITTDIAAEVLALEPRVDHNIIDICSQIVEGKEITPLSALQANSPNARLKIWTDLQALCDPRLEARMVEIEHILAQSSNLAPHQYFDAVTDIAILNRDSFKPFKPQLTSRAFDCLLRYCKSEQYAKFYEGLYHVPDFLCKLELMIMEMPERVPMSELHYLATLSGVLRCWITPLRLFPYDERREL